jgi:hypothetical protein
MQNEIKVGFVGVPNINDLMGRVQLLDEKFNNTRNPNQQAGLNIKASLVYEAPRAYVTLNTLKPVIVRKSHKKKRNGRKP